MSEWNDCAFNELTLAQLARIYRLRAQVFNGEQAASYPDPDAKDEEARHLFASENGRVVAYARYFATPTGVTFGRVVVARDRRGSGLGGDLLRHLLAGIGRHFPGRPVEIDAQLPVIGYYEHFGFTASGPVFVEAEREHRRMVHPPLN